MGVAAEAAPTNKARSMGLTMILSGRADGIEIIRVHSRGRGRSLALPPCVSTERTCISYFALLARDYVKFSSTSGQ